MAVAPRGAAPPGRPPCLRVRLGSPPGLRGLAWLGARPRARPPSPLLEQPATARLLRWWRVEGALPPPPESRCPPRRGLQMPAADTALYGRIPCPPAPDPVDAAAVVACRWASRWPPPPRFLGLCRACSSWVRPGLEATYTAADGSRARCGRRARQAAGRSFGPACPVGMKILRVLLTTTVASVDVTFLREGVVGALQLPGPGSIFLCSGHRFSLPKP